MAVTDQAARVAPYVEQLLDDDKVRENIRRAADATCQAYGRARGKKRASKTLKDRTVQRRVQEAMHAAGEAVDRLALGPQKPKRARPGRALAGLAIGAGLAVALNPEVRKKALALLGGENGAATRTAVPVRGEGQTSELGQ